jgi:hypothetical protein
MVFLLDALVPALAGFTARPYGLMLAFTALTYASWQSATAREQKRFWPLAGVAAGIAGAVGSHHFGLLNIFLILATGEATRLHQRRRVDTALLTAIAVGLAPLAFTLPLAHRSRVLLGEAVFHSANFWAKPSVANLMLYILFVSVPLLILTLVFTFLLRPHSSSSGPHHEAPPVPAHEWAAAGALSLLLPVQIVLAFVETGYFQEKYAIGTSLGLALVCAWGLPHANRLRRAWPHVFATATLSTLIFSAARLTIAQIRNPVWRANPAQIAASPLLDHAPGDWPIAVANAFDYMPDWWYSPPALRARLTYISDLPTALQQPEFLPELSLSIDRAFVPTPVVDYSAFLASHPHFLLLCTGRPRLNWIGPRLSAEGWQLTPLARSGASDVLYRVDHRPDVQPVR